MPRYLLLIYGDEKAAAGASPEEVQQVMEAYGKYTQDLQNAGLMQGGEALEPTATATTVQVRNGKTLTTDGPFAETKEQLGGFYQIQARNLDEALEWASKIPGALRGSIEVRPIMEFEQG